MSRQLHGDGTGDTGALEVPDGGAAEVVEHPADDLGAHDRAPLISCRTLDRGMPRHEEVPDRPALPVEYIRNNLAGTPLYLLRVLTLPLEQRLEPRERVERELPPFPVLRIA